MTPRTDEKASHPSLPVRVMNAISRVCLALAGLALTLIVLINGVNVFCRYVLKWALSWAEEGMVFLMIAGVFVGVITVTWESLHIRIEALIDMLGARWRLAAEWLAVLITASVLLPMGWVSWGVVGKLYRFDQRSDALHLPVWIPQLTIPFALIAIPLVMVLVLLLRRRGGHDRL
jgi:TRAP-type C4-dicarboxylate transport system permease small subunit